MDHANLQDFDHPNVRVNIITQVGNSRNVITISFSGVVRELCHTISCKEFPHPLVYSTNISGALSVQTQDRGMSYIV